MGDCECTHVISSNQYEGRAAANDYVYGLAYSERVQREKETLKKKHVKTIELDFFYSDAPLKKKKRVINCFDEVFSKRHNKKNRSIVVGN